MSNVEKQSELGPITRVCQIIVGSLIAGVIWFLAIILSGLVTQNPPAGKQALSFGLENWQDWPVTTVAIVFALVGFPASFLVPRVMVEGGRRRIAQGTWTASTPPRMPAELLATDVGKLALIYQNQLIVGSALNEGVTFFALIAYMVEGQPVILGLAILLILGLVARFPTLGRVENWIESQQDLLLQDRQAAF